MAYCTLAELKTYLNSTSTSTSQDTILTHCLNAAESYIDARCNTSFAESTGTRYYRSDDLKALPDMGGNTGWHSWDTWNGTASPTLRNVLWLGKDCLSVQTLLNGDGSTVSSTSYWLEPRNDKPYQWIRLKTDESWLFDTDGEITVTGTWGASTAAGYHVQQAVLRVAAYWNALRQSQVFDVTAIPELGAMTIPKGVPADLDRILRDCGLINEIRFA